MKKLLFYFFLIILIAVKLIAIINMTDFWVVIEKETLFIASSIAQGVNPLLRFFQPPGGIFGGGSFLYGLMATPFILIFGKSYFSLRLASIILLILTFCITYRFCNKYFNYKTALFTSLLFIITPEVLTSYSVVGVGRHFHLNLFFILNLYLFSKIKEEGKTLYYVLFGMVCGLGIYFYPGYLPTVFIFGLFLLSDINIKQLSFLYKYGIIFLFIVIAGYFLELGRPWYQNFYNVIIGFDKKSIMIYDNPFFIVPRFFHILCEYVPQIFISPTFALSGNESVMLFSLISRSSDVFLKSSARNLEPIQIASLLSIEILRFIFILAYVLLFWCYRGYIKKIIRNTFSWMHKSSIPMKEYIISFLLVHLFLYVFMFSFNNLALDNVKYFLPLFLNVILIIALFLNGVWKRSKSVSFCGLFIVLIPGIFFQGFNITTFSFDTLYKQYIYFYEDRCAEELATGMGDGILKSMCNSLDIRVCHTIGDALLFENVIDIPPKFKYISNGDINKEGLLYQGYIKGLCTKSIKSLEEVLNIIGEFDKRYWEHCYRGLGEGLMKHSFPLNDEVFDEGIFQEIIEDSNTYIKKRYKKYFFQGLGEGLARQFAVSFSEHITENGLYDENILNGFVHIIDDTYKNDFLSGFFNNDIWRGF